MKKFLIVLALPFLFPIFANAQSVDILAQGEGYVSSFYKGRTLWSKGSVLTLLAVPQSLGSPNLLNYRWSRNGTILGAVSGIGKNTLSFMDTVFSKPVTISVEIVDVNDNILAKGETIVNPIPPFISIYENNPLYGFLFHRNISGAYQMESREITFTAFPFLFNTLRRESTSLPYRWSGSEGVSSITYRLPDKGSGTAEVRVSLTHTESIMQTAEKAFLVNFGEDEKN
jgi:hypothetical protein